MNVLVCGGAGYIGGAITDLLPDARVYDNLVYEHEYRKDIDFVLGDIRDHKKLKEQLDWADTVIWLAAIVGDGACASNPALTQELNTDAVKWLADNFDGRIVFPSTCSVYGAQDELLDENSPTNPLSVYASTKLEAESYLKDKNAMIFRLGTVFGVSDQFSRIRLDLVVNTMTARAYTQGKLQVFGGEQWRPLIHVKDVAQEIVNAITSDETGIRNLCTKNMRMIDLARIVEANFLNKIEVEVVDIKFEDARNYRVVENVKDGLDVARGVNDILNVMHRVKDPNSPRYSNVAFMEQSMELINGGLAVDDRGKVTFVNDFDFSKVKRFYMIENWQQLWTRAWHGHKKEGKYAFVVNGAAQIGTVNMETEEVKTFFLSADKPQILFIPPGHYNNARAFAPNTKIIFYSTMTMEEAKDDDYREPSTKWLEAWNVEER